MLSRLTSQKIPPLRPVPCLSEDALAGLVRAPRSMPPKYFYDDRGSQLFDAICETPEYYPTRTEDALLAHYAGEIIDQVRPKHIVEFGSGAARKTRQLLDVCDELGGAAAYWPFDVCESMLLESGRRLVRDYEWLTVNALVGDYLAGLQHVPRPPGSCLYLFLGGTIGNFSETQAQRFLHDVRAQMSADDHLLLGADRIKDVAVLNAAYNDRQGVTAAFNLNLLEVLNRELDGDFHLPQFEHQALFNADDSQMEMYLVSSCNQSVTLKALQKTLDFHAGEKILTEISRKFTPERLNTLLTDAGFNVVQHLQPANGYFSLMLAKPVI